MVTYGYHIVIQTGTHNTNYGTHNTNCHLSLTEGDQGVRPTPERNFRIVTSRMLTRDQILLRYLKHIKYFSIKFYHRSFHTKYPFLQ